MELKIVVVAKNEKDYAMFRETLVGINRIWTIKEQWDTILEHELCIILSPVTDAEAALIETANKLKIICFIGVTRLTSHYPNFTSSETLSTLISQAQEAWLSQLKQTYLEHTVCFNAHDEAYINHLREGQGMPRITAKKTKLTFKNRQSGLKMISIIGDINTACQIAKAYKHIQSGKVLVIDGDFLKPSFDEKFGIAQIETGVRSHLTGKDNTGINILLDALQKGLSPLSLLPQVVIKHNDHLDILLGNYNPYNYEHYEPNRLTELLAVLSAHYETLLIALPFNFYDEFTLLAVHQSDTVIFLSEAKLSEVRHLMHMKNILESRQKVTADKLYYCFKWGGSIKSLVSKAAVKRLFGTQALTYSRRHVPMKIVNQLGKVRLR